MVKHQFVGKDLAADTRPLGLVDGFVPENLGIRCVDDL